MEKHRLAVGIKLNIRDEVAGIYICKFGGIYYSGEAFEIFKTAFEHFKNDFKLIILIPDNRLQVRNKLIEIGVNRENSFVACVSHDEVPSYLSAADFAFALNVI